MDFVGDDLDVVACADLGEAREFVGAPESTCGVVGVAEQEECYVGVGGDFVEVVEVDFVGESVVGEVDASEWVFDDAASVVSDG